MAVNNCYSFVLLCDFYFTHFCLFSAFEEILWLFLQRDSERKNVKNRGSVWVCVCIGILLPTIQYEVNVQYTEKWQLPNASSMALHINYYVKCTITTLIFSFEKYLVMFTFFIPIEVPICSFRNCIWSYSVALFYSLEWSWILTLNHNRPLLKGIKPQIKKIYVEYIRRYKNIFFCYI